MNKEDLVYIYIYIYIYIYTYTHTHTHYGILLSQNRNEIGSYIVMWMNPESVIQSEIRKRKTNIV